MPLLNVASAAEIGGYFTCMDLLDPHQMLCNFDGGSHGWSEHLRLLHAGPRLQGPKGANVGKEGGDGPGENRLVRHDLVIHFFEAPDET